MIIKISGGLGNQMFQYACSKNLSLINNYKLKLDLTYFYYEKLRDYELEKIFEIKEEKVNFRDLFKLKGFFSTLEKFLFKKNYILKSSKNYLIENKNIYFNNKNINNDSYLEGYFQSEKYFIENKDKIIKLFKFKLNDLNSKNKIILKDIKKTNSISIHIRRTDYLNHHEILNLEIKYYLNAIEKIQKKLRSKKVVIYVFSDDIKWVKNNFKKYLEKMVFIDFNFGEKSYLDMFLMSKCKHNIIANSSFSWWGAYLNKNNNKIVITPKKWLKHSEKINEFRCPKNWIRI